MPFYVYENWVAQDKAVIHKGDCGYCKNGIGCHDNPLKDQNGQWHGKGKPFETYQEAKDFAESLNKKKLIVHSCIKIEDKD